MLLLIGCSQALSAAERPAPDLEAGRKAYQQQCARCHGIEGHGDGVDAKRFYPRPRDFTVGVYKFRSTASGTPPTDEDLFRTLTQGLPGTNMPDWRHLDEETRWQLVNYLKSLSPVFGQTAPALVALSHDPGPKADLAKGKEIFAKLGCAACHGAAGRANGTSAAGLTDDWNLPIRPADLTQGWSYRGGAAPGDIVMRLTAGIDGAGMPSYAEAVSPEEAWHLAYYVASLQEPAHWNMLAHPLVVDGALPDTLDDPRWAAAEQTDVRLRNVVNADGQWDQPPTVKAVSFRAIANAEGIAWLVSWDDPTKDAEASAADRLVLLLKPEASQGDVITLQAWPYAGSPKLDLSQWSAQRNGVVEALAMNFDSVLTLGSREVARKSAAAYEDGRWRLLIQRPRHPSDLKDGAQIDSARFTSMAFAVWDGGNATARAVSPWVELAFPHRASHH